MDKDTEQTFRDILKNACRGLEEIAQTSKSMNSHQAHQINMFLADMRVNYFMEKPRSAIEEGRKNACPRIDTPNAIKMLARALYDTYKELV